MPVVDAPTKKLMMAKVKKLSANARPVPRIISKDKDKYRQSFRPMLKKKKFKHM